jgi:hypothetical protein
VAGGGSIYQQQIEDPLPVCVLLLLEMPHLSQGDQLAPARRCIQELPKAPVAQHPGDQRPHSQLQVEILSQGFVGF